MDKDFEVIATACECCDDVTYHIPVDYDSVTYHPENGFILHLNEDEMTALYFQLKEYKCGLKDPEVLANA